MKKIYLILFTLFILFYSANPLLALIVDDVYWGASINVNNYNNRDVI